MTPARFRKLVYTFYEQHGRHTLPWRKTHDPYKVLVSEIMLQQTQVERVIPFYRAFLYEFPTVRALAGAPLSAVLIRWQGLGYNRRAKMLHEAAKKIVADFGGKLPTAPEALETLPGIGHYTARAVAAFAHNTDVVFVETNLRTVVMHHFFADQEKVSDAEILAVLTRMYPKGDARRWYAALMDYGTHLKRSGVRTNAKSTQYTKQKAFAGSAREARGAILRALASGAKTTTALTKLVPAERKEQLMEQLHKLTQEGFIQKTGRIHQLSKT